MLTLAKLPGKTSLQVLPAKGINSSLFIYNLYHWEHNYRFFFPLHKYTTHAPTSVYLTQNSQIVKQNPTQDTTGLDNCRPVSRLLLISKITRKTTAYQLTSFFSWLRDIVLKKSIPVTRPNQQTYYWSGISGTALKFNNSYLTETSKFIITLSLSSLFSCDISQSSTLVPFLLSLHISCFRDLIFLTAAHLIICSYTFLLHLSTSFHCHYRLSVFKYLKTEAHVFRPDSFFKEIGH